MSVDRPSLERAAMESVTADAYYDLCDTIEEASDKELQDIVDGCTPASLNYPKGVNDV
jgi:hypothetical protein